MTTLAFAGCAHIHTPGFLHAIARRSDSVRVKSLYDHDPARAAQRAKQAVGSVVADSIDEIVNDAEVDAVIICSETNLHADLVEKITAAKKHVFVEKPLGFLAADALAMADAIEATGVLFTTGYFMRGDAKILFLKRQIEAGAFGTITRVRASNCHSGALGGWFDDEWRWMADPTRSGCGGFGDLGTHSLDILLWLFGPLESGIAQIDNGTARYENCDEYGEALLRFENGITGTLAAGWDDVADPVTFQICGTRGHAVIVNNKLHFQSELVEGADGSAPMRNAEIGPGLPAGLDAFLDHLTGKGTPPLVGPREAAYRSAVMAALYESSRKGERVKVN